MAKRAKKTVPTTDASIDANPETETPKTTPETGAPKSKGIRKAANMLSDEERASAIGDLLGQLESATAGDPKKKSLRRRLRNLGHWGGLNGKGSAS